MKKMMNKKGFTLIELMVVIAIIAILSGIIIVVLSSARKKSQDSAIKQQLIHLRTQANLYLVTNGNYGTAGAVTTCSGGVFSDSKITPLFTAIPTTEACAHDGGQNFIVVAPLIGVTGKSWCVDGKNGSKLVTTDTANSGTELAGASYDCSNLP